MRKHPKKNVGFTLVELMVTVAIAAIIMGVAIPNFTSIITSNRLTASANELVTALNLARSEAIKRGANVIVKSESGTDSDWAGGWKVFVNYDETTYDIDDDGNATKCEAGEDCLLRVSDPLPVGFTLRSGNNFACWIEYSADGRSKGSASDCTGDGLGNDTFRLCDSSENTSTSRSIIVSNTGRMRVEPGTDSCP